MHAMLLALCLAASSGGGAFQVTSPEVQDQKPLREAQVYHGYGCKGGNASPALRWRFAPAGTKSFAVTVFDPDAPTGHGFWHWIVYDIPPSAEGLPAGVRADTLPAGAVQGRNDFGMSEYSGACPPPGDRPHRYVFTVYALRSERLGLSAGAAAQEIEARLEGNALAKATLTATYGR